MYVHRRQLRWLGHVSRMDHETRLPRRMLIAIEYPLHVDDPDDVERAGCYRRDDIVCQRVWPCETHPCTVHE